MVKSLKRKLNLKKRSTIRRNKSRKQRGGEDNIKSREYLDFKANDFTLKMYYGKRTDILKFLESITSNPFYNKLITQLIPASNPFFLELKSIPSANNENNIDAPYILIVKPNHIEYPYPDLVKKFYTDVTTEGSDVTKQIQNVYPNK